MKPNPELIDDENPEWTTQDFKQAVSFSELPISLQSKLAGLKKPTESLEFVTVGFELDVLDTFRKTGADWQTQINFALKQWLQEHPLSQSA